ncbi:uncharacterized protein LOC124303289 isoform X2 [Neodiprion virginianus]|uniref:uncharacterized protein LOC124180921 isoform X2 n=1 Tax=Neodiprion fabricii TaxID=2872261 RepID=UPI001ED951E9|nr:uncharacterized protein LOC124180921 isoform X2 [Neodiprion fabricii]XP_046616292.1 uncharacterized protein LOC124303289 isoform X2 [Neodiprion virginianus]
MELDILHKYALKILTLFLVIAMVLMMTTCQDEIDYSNEDNPYDDDYGSFIGVKYENNDDRLPIKANTVSKKITREALKCDENQLMTYLAELQVTNPESLLLIASYKDLDHLCRRIAGNLDSIDIFLQTCTPLPQDHLYMQLIAGLRVLSTKLCVECSYQKSYQKYLSCFHELHTEYIDCAGPADWTENMAHNELCNEYKSIADCYYTKSAMLCGIKAAKIMKELVVRVINGIIDTHCPEVRKNPTIPNPMPESVFSKGTIARCFVHNLNHILTWMTKLLYY